MAEQQDARDGATTRKRSGRRGVATAVAATVTALVILAGALVQPYLANTRPAEIVLAITSAAYRIQYRIVPPGRSADDEDLRSLHLVSAGISTPKCVACHGTMLDSQVAFHRIHLENHLLPGLECNDCHRRVDLRPDAKTGKVDWVDVGVCRNCHLPFPGLSDKCEMTPADFNADCTTCHTGARAPKHTSKYLSRTIAPHECKGCHGGRALGWDALHERDDWFDLHGDEALRNGVRSCYSCHDFGMKFCDTCHSELPASHKPAEEWKRDHPAAAKADTRVCHTCHEVESCKRCHLSHEPGWRDRHPTFVHKQGSSSCRRCHSESFCTYCHMSASSGSTPTAVK